MISIALVKSAIACSVVALGLKGAAPGKIGVAVLRIDFDRLTIIRDCAVDFAFSSVDRQHGYSKFWQAVG